jgi:hypothetical protein
MTTNRSKSNLTAALLPSFDVLDAGSKLTSSKAGVLSVRHWTLAGKSSVPDQR